MRLPHPPSLWDLRFISFIIIIIGVIINIVIIIVIVISIVITNVILIIIVLPMITFTITTIIIVSITVGIVIKGASAMDDLPVWDNSHYILMPFVVLPAILPYPLFWFAISFLILFLGIGPLPPPAWFEWEPFADFVDEYIDVLDYIRNTASWLIAKFLLGLLWLGYIPHRSITNGVFY